MILSFFMTLDINAIRLVKGAAAAARTSTNGLITHTTGCCILVGYQYSWLGIVTLRLTISCIFGGAYAEHVGPLKSSNRRHSVLELPWDTHCRHAAAHAIFH